ncbi:hypothetical protein [Myroides sp. LJL119]
MNYNLEIQKILLNLENIEDHNDKVIALKQAIKIADKHNDIDWGFDLRLNLIQKERNTSRCEESFVAFAWILDTSDSNEDYFDESEFLWEYKWMFNSAYRNASIPMEQVLAIGEDLKKRLLKNGYSLRAYYNVMTGLASHLRDYTKAHEYIELSEKHIVDDMTNCPACELDSKVENLLVRGYLEESLVAASDLVNKKLTCYSMPFNTFCNYAYQLDKISDPRAEEFFEKALAEYYQNNKLDSSVGYSMNQLVSYMAKHNHKDLWNFFERISEWELGAEDLHILNFAKYMAPIMKQGGEQVLNLSPKLPYYKSDGVYDLSELYVYFKDRAYHYAKLFDQRNGNNNFVLEVDKMLA